MRKRNPRVLHACVCEFRPKTYAEARKHQATCGAWKQRKDPRSLSITRRRASLMKPPQGCPDVTELEKHEPFRQLLAKHGLDARAFAKVLKVLERRFSVRPFMKSSRLG